MKGVYRNPKLLKLARLSPCQWCGTSAGQDNVVACHLQGFRAQGFGKGTGIKPNDACTAFLCNECHDLMDRRKSHPTISELEPGEYAELWGYLILKTHLWLLREGHLEVKG